MSNLKMKLNQYEINIDLDNPNVLIYGKVGTGKTVLTDKLIKSIKDDFILIESQNYGDFTSYLCEKELKKSQNELINKIGNLGDLELHLLKEITIRESIEAKETLIPILINLDELEVLLADRYKNAADITAYKSRMNHFLEVGPRLGIHFIITSQSKQCIYPIRADLFATQLKTQQEIKAFGANINIVW